MAKALAMMTRYPGSFALMLFSMLGLASYSVANPLLFKVVFDAGFNQGDTTAMAWALAGLGGNIVLFTLGGIGFEKFGGRLATRVSGRIRQSLFDKLLVLDESARTDQSPEAMTARFSEDVAAIETGLLRGYLPFVLEIACIALSVLILFILDWRLALVALGAVPLVLLAPKAFSRRAAHWDKQAGQDRATLATVVRETIDSYSVIRLFNLGAMRRAMLMGAETPLEESAAHAHFHGGMVGRAAYVATGLAQLAVIGVGAWLVVLGLMTTGDLIAFVGLLLNIGSGVKLVTGALSLVSSGKGAMMRVDEFLALPSQPEEPHDAIRLTNPKSLISMRDIGFSYRPGTRILNGLTVDIPIGARTAIVGPSGCGKSTVLALLLRLRRPENGTIHVGGQHLERASEESLRDTISAVPQSATLFQGSVRDNILIGRPEADQKSVENAARAAQIHDVITALPKGYDTIVGTGGVQLSGGQRQRLSIARALLRDAPILLLDEATAALDPSSEAEVNRTIDSLAGQRTIVSVTHRLHPLTGYDRIIVLDHGRVLEWGTHGDLMRNGGLYRQLWDKQHGFEIDPKGHSSVLPERLAAIPFLSGCDKAVLDRLSSNFTSVEFKEGRTVFQEGDRGDSFYIVTHGKLEVVIDDKPFEFLRDGDFFGEIALVWDMERAATVRAAVDSLCLRLSADHFHRLLEDEPRIHDLVVETLMERMQTIRAQKTEPTNVAS